MADDDKNRRDRMLARRLKSRVERNHALTIAAMNLATRAEINANDFLAIASHDLLTPLSAMTGAAVSIRENASAAAQLRSWADDLVRSAESMERLIRAIEFGAFDGGQLRLAAAPHDLTAIVHCAANTLLPFARAKSIALSRDVVETVTVNIDGSRILHVLLNLLDNAIKFTPAGGRVRVRVSQFEAACLVAVVDTGAGIPRSKLASIFAPVSQRDADDPARCGLGLYISRLIVEAHGGRLWAESEAGAGSTLYFTLPAV